MNYLEIPEEIVVQLAAECGPESAAQKVLDEAKDIRARGRLVRFLFDGDGLCVQEGVAMVDSSDRNVDHG